MIMISVWWDVDGNVHFELVHNGLILKTVLCSEQLGLIYNAPKQKYHILIRHKRATESTLKIEELDKIEVLYHPAYRCDLANSDYGLYLLKSIDFSQSYRNGTVIRSNNLQNFSVDNNGLDFEVFKFCCV